MKPIPSLLLFINNYTNAKKQTKKKQNRLFGGVGWLGFFWGVLGWLV